MHKVIFVQIISQVVFSLGVCYNVISECYQNTPTVDVMIFSDCFIIGGEKGVCGDTLV